MLRRRQVQVAVPLSGGGWTPVQSLSGNVPRLRLLADDLTGNDGDAVTTWTSKEGNAYGFTQSTANQKPLLKKGANGINGHNVVRADGSNDILKYASANISTDTQGTLFAVLRINASHVDNPNLLSSSSDADTHHQIGFKNYRDSTNPNMAIYKDNGGTPSHIRGSTSVLVDTVYLMVWASSGTAYILELNGNAETEAAIGGANSGDWFGDVATRSHFTLFGAETTSESNYCKVDLAELVLYPHNASANDLAKFESYASRTYGINFP